MSLAIEFHNDIDPSFVLAMMEKHRLLPDAMRANPATIAAFANASACIAITDDEDYKAFILETVLAEGVMDLTAFVLDREIIKKRGEIESFQYILRDKWFGSGEIRRIQTYIPITRKNTKRLFVYLGFIQETRDCGLRSLLKINGKEESCVAMGLLPGDPIRENVVQAEVIHA
jgi:hypothetical protein